MDEVVKVFNPQEGMGVGVSDKSREQAKDASHLSRPMVFLFVQRGGPSPGQAEGRSADARPRVTA